MLAYCGVPLLLTTDDGFFAPTSADQVVAAVQRQVDGMRAASYARSEILSSEVTVSPHFGACRTQPLISFEADRAPAWHLCQP